MSLLCIAGWSAADLVSTHWVPVAAPHTLWYSTGSPLLSVWLGGAGWLLVENTALASQCPCFAERKSDSWMVPYCSGAEPGRGPGPMSCVSVTVPVAVALLTLVEGECWVASTFEFCPKVSPLPAPHPPPAAPFPPCSGHLGSPRPFRLPLWN